MSRYVIVGAGGVGSALAAGFEDAGTPYALISRRGPVRLTHAGRTRTLDTVADVALRDDDVLVLAVKTQDVHATLVEWAWRPGKPATVLTLQNGLEAERAAARYFPEVVGGVTLTAATHVVGGEVQVANTPRLGQLILGGPSAERLAADLRAANWLVQVVDDLPRWKAWKLTRAVAFAAGVFDGPTEALQAALIEEAQAVLAAAGYDLADPERELTLDPSQAAIDPAAGYSRQSTLQSFVRGASSEVDFLNGEVVLLARLHGVEAPVNAAVQRVLGRSAWLREAPHVHHVDEVLAAVAA